MNMKAVVIVVFLSVESFLSLDSILPWVNQSILNPGFTATLQASWTAPEGSLIGSEGVLAALAAAVILLILVLCFRARKTSLYQGPFRLPYT